MRDIFELAKTALSGATASDRIRIKFDEESKTIRIFDASGSALVRASSGLSEVLELSYTSAEHHPYWSILYHSAEICKTIIDSWDAEITNESIGELEWRIEEIKMALERAKH